ncbi:MAG: HEAT repeat domain-containing protein [Phycisphaerae bacterium]|nr:HEAT repeat domain-containing protein [Phycisphaerae bacterium]
MWCMKRTFLKGSFVVLPFLLLCLAMPVQGYVDLAPTLSKVVGDSKQIAVVEVVGFHREKRTVTLKPVRKLKGDAIAGVVKHEVAVSQGAAIPRHIMQWADPGSQAVLFVSRNTGLVCVGQGWYQVRLAGTDAWKLGVERPDLPLAYYGPVSRLADGIESMLAGKDAVLSTVAHGADEIAASFDLALNRASLPGLVKVERIRANLKMPPMVLAASANPAYLIGQGPVDEADLPALMEKLKAADAVVRADSADDLGWLAAKAATAEKPLTALLADSASRVRVSAATALLRIVPKNADALVVLRQALVSSDHATRLQAVKGVGLVGSAAAPLIDVLGGLLKEGDEPTRIAALQAISMLGPVAAAQVGVVTRLLDDPELMIDAADALGRIGAAARPSLRRLAQMLTSDQPAVQWAAVRAMSQIGGEEAHPAVDFMVKKLPSATEVEGYNMMIYLALLGPVAKDAIPTIRSVRIKNPVLPSATCWAIESDRSFPWLGGGRGGPGGPGGPPGMGGGGGGPDFAVYIYEAYVVELGDRLRPAARLLAQKIADGTAGDIPDWGYKILSCGRDEALGVFLPLLSDRDKVMRERAVVALGFMGPSADAARSQVEAALQGVSSEREKRLIEWCLRELAHGPRG